jgi:hypothetical protein
MVAALRANVLVFFQVGLVQHGFATRTFDPQAFGHAAALGGVGGAADFRGQEFF